MAAGTTDSRGAETRPESVLSRFAPEAVYLMGGGRAILLQLALPGVGHGVARHSNFAVNPLGRLNGTLTYIYALSNGTDEQRAKVRSIVHAAHAPVKAPAAQDGSHPAYSARDPKLQLWVAATLYDSAMQIQRAVFPPLDDDTAEALYRDYAQLGTELGMPAHLWPATRADFAEYWAETLGQLRVDAPVRAVAHELLAAKQAPPWIRAAMPLVRLMTIGLLPERVRAMFGFAFSPRQQRRMDQVLRCARISMRVLPRRIRHFPMHFYLRRLDGR
ncbi:oxygenase MpaB family protein [Paeniglutamicibacter sulfureus]|uniref:oxygenase MpaB family protein n=1 Tax=Paeniglutamicibacter sulfureus TaxID=43666 RepID=UPI002664E49A|nr:oxygenase MpaB family protein [Paeniglutamicibacter sulfureus]MDO2934784.1 oxygenase MpaB family protein [Paeniglutamicibacter sulfureus]